MPGARRLEFIDRSKEDLSDFPASARRRAGMELWLVQIGETPSDWKPMKTIGPGAVEIRIHDETGAFRVIYVAKFEDAIYVLHCFERKSQKTSQRDVDLATARYRRLAGQQSARRRSL